VVKPFKPGTSSSSKTASGTRVNIGFFQGYLPEKVNLLIQTRGLHTTKLPGREFFRKKVAKKAENGVWGGNLQVTPLHRGHRREGAGLLSFWGVGEMSFVIEKVVSGASFKTTLCGSESQSCVKDSHRHV
jgi:hypothetical protein